MGESDFKKRQTSKTEGELSLKKGLSFFSAALLFSIPDLLTSVSSLIELRKVSILRFYEFSHVT